MKRYLLTYLLCALIPGLIWVLSVGAAETGASLCVFRVAHIASLGGMLIGLLTLCALVSLPFLLKEAFSIKLLCLITADCASFSALLQLRFRVFGAVWWSPVESLHAAPNGMQLAAVYCDKWLSVWMLLGISGLLWTGVATFFLTELILDE